MNSRLRRGQIWLDDDKRTWLIIGSGRLLEASPVVPVIPVSKPQVATRLKPPLIVQLPQAVTDLPEAVWGHVFAVSTIPSAKLNQMLGTIKDQALADLDESLKKILDLA